MEDTDDAYDHLRAGGSDRLRDHGRGRGPGREGHNQGIKKGEREESQEQGDRIPELADLPDLRRQMEENSIWIIRFSDGELRSHHGTFEEAREVAERLKNGREYIII